MQEKAMVSDALNSINAGLNGLEGMITQTENQDLRQILIKMRNDTETSQYELYTLAKNKNYYTPAQQANPQEIDSLKASISNSNQVR